MTCVTTTVACHADGVFWADLGEADRAAIEAVAVRRTYAAGEPVFFQGDPGNHALIILRGSVRITRGSAAGSGVLIELRGPGDLVGEVAVIDALPRSGTAWAPEPLEVLLIPAGHFRTLLRERDSITWAVLMTMAQRLRHSVERRLEVGTNDTFRILCSRLDELSAGLSPDADGVVEITSSLSQQELAEWIGVSRDAVVLALRRLRELGWVETGRRRIRVLDPAAIAQVAAEQR
jgi:CRP/FNR family cyclic AMP-dependent transcriptional regulator